MTEQQSCSKTASSFSWSARQGMAEENEADSNLTFE